MIFGSSWAAQAAAMQASWAPTMTVRPAVAVVHSGRSGQVAHSSAANTNSQAGRPLWSVVGRASVVTSPAGQVTSPPSTLMSKKSVSG